MGKPSETDNVGKLNGLPTIGKFIMLKGKGKSDDTWKVPVNGTIFFCKPKKTSKKTRGRR